jgi:hypothetical protein
MKIVGNFEGLIYSLNFSEPFNTSGSQIPSLSGDTAQNLSPNYLDGAMFSNDYEFALYGYDILYLILSVVY